MRRRPLVTAGDLDDEPAVRALLRSDDARDVRLGLDLLAGLASPAPEAELRRVAAGADPDVRVRALVQLAEDGEAQAAAAVRSLARDLAVEALDVALSRAEAAIAVPLVCHDGVTDGHAPVWRRGGPPARSRQEWIADAADDPDGVWRSSWLAACASAASVTR